MAVIAADELDHLGAAGHAAGKAQRAHGGFRAGVHHAHHFHGRKRRADFFGQQDFGFAGSAVARAAQGGLLDGLGHFRMGMADEHGAPGTKEVDEMVAVHGGEVRALSFGNEKGIGIDVAAGAHRAVDAAGDDFLRMGEKRTGTFGIHVSSCRYLDGSGK